MSNQTLTWPGGARAAISLSFDDARLTQPDVGLPILDVHGVRATFYVSPPNVPARLNVWRRAVAEGHEIGNHSLSHPCSGTHPWSRGNALEDYTLARMEQELLAANAYIQQTFGLGPRTFAYPCGQTFVGRGEGLQSYVPLIAKHFWVGRGFRDEGSNDPMFSDLAQAYGVDADNQSWDQLQAWMEDALNNRGWLIFCMHEIADEPRLATKPDILDKLCRHITDPQNGFWVDTVARVAEHIRTQRHEQAGQPA